MIISESRVLLAATHETRKFSQVRESLTQWNTASNPVRTENSTRTGKVQPTEKNAASEDMETVSASDRQLTLKIALVSMLYEKLTGKKLQLFDPSKMQEKNQDIENANKTLDDIASGTRSNQQQAVGWGLEYDRHEKHYESEQVSFNASASVITSDGKQIEVELELNMSREFITENSISIRAGDALKDPLVINYAGRAVELTTQKISFDIDIDGNADEIAFVKPGSGFLTYDKNGNGRVDDGSELFGAKTGDGFAELATHDQDNNGWIDEQDAIFKHLSVWSRLPDGSNQLLGIAEHDVGAIYLGRASTEFSLNDVANTQLGQVRSTGIFLSESGKAGTVQQVDLVA